MQERKAKITVDSSDEEILAEYYLHGDLSLFAIIYKRYLHLVYGISLKYLTDVEDAKEMCSGIFTDLSTALRKHQVSNFRSWLYTFSKNACFQYLRKHKSEKDWKEKYKEEFDYQQTVNYDPEKDLNEARLEKAMEELPEYQKKAIICFYFEKLTYKGSAEKLNITEKEIKTHLQNAKRNLRIAMEKQAGGDDIKEGL